MYNSDVANSETFGRFAKIVAMELHVDAAKVTLDSYLDDLGMESLDLMGIIIELERQFHICMPEKGILQTAQEVFGAGVLEKDGVVTEVVEYVDLGQLYAQIGAVPPDKVWAKRAHVSAIVSKKPKTQRR